MVRDVFFGDAHDTIAMLGDHSFLPVSIIAHTEAGFD